MYIHRSTNSAKRFVLTTTAVDTRYKSDLPADRRDTVATNEAPDGCIFVIFWSVGRRFKFNESTIHVWFAPVPFDSARYTEVER